MPYVSQEDIQAAKQVDLLSWLQMNEPSNLVKLSGNNYCTEEHDSLKISNGKWYWFSRGVGGVSALDYLIKVKEYTLPQAVNMIKGTGAESSFFYVPKQERTKHLLMPEVEKYPYQAVRYLSGRGISKEIIEYCIINSMLFESSKYHNAVFVGYDNAGVARYASLRGTMSKYKGEVTGSNKRYSFCIRGDEKNGTLHLFESAIDLLSFASIEQMKGNDWKKDDLLSLAGVFKMKTTDRVSVALTQFLSDNPHVKIIHLHLDNDDVGRGAAIGIQKVLGNKYTVIDEPPSYGKDMNDTLMQMRREKRRKEEHER